MKKLLVLAWAGAALLSGGMLRAENILLSTRNSSLLLTAEKGKTPLFQYFGARVASPDDILASGAAFGDAAYPQFGAQCYREVAIQATHGDGSMSLELAVESVSRDRRDGSETTAIAMKDKHYPFFVTLFYKTYDDCEVIETWTEISHTEKKPVTLYRFASAYMPVRRGDTWLTHFHGTWGAECYLHEEPLTDGMKVLKNKDGVRNTQRDNPSLMISLDGRPRELTGRVIGGTLAWAGNYRIALDNDNTHTTHLFAGINEEQSQYTLQPREVFTTPVFAFTFSDEGKSGVSRNIHRWARLHRLNHGTELRDVLLNSWEGVYFKVNQEGMDRMMADLADLGGELFVMDDGWFGDKYPRNNGETSLGDWTVCREKLPQGIEGLTESARKHGVKFGIWIEPEMTNTRSELYEKHPDWVIQQPYRENRKGRGGTQQVLDLSNPAVQEFVFGVVDRLMTAHPDIAYIKWDDNMTLYNYGSTFLPADRQSHLYIEYHRGMDKVLRRIREKYPRLVMQSCASGGGRVNYGVLPYYDEFWTSDNTDALQRIYMQWGVSNFYPAVAMASHVSASPNHQTGRNVPLKLRFDVAMSGRLGLELQPSKMTGKEKEFARRAIRLQGDPPHRAAGRPLPADLALRQDRLCIADVRRTRKGPRRLVRLQAGALPQHAVAGLPHGGSRPRQTLPDHRAERRREAGPAGRQDLQRRVPDGERTRIHGGQGICEPRTRTQSGGVIIGQKRLSEIRTARQIPETTPGSGRFVSGIPHLFSLFSLHIRRFIRLAAIPAAAFFTHKGFNKASCHLIMNYEL